MNILLSGATGAMGQVVAKTVLESPDAHVVFGWSEKNDTSAGFPISNDLNDAPENVDVIVDFSIHDTAKTLLPFAVERGLPVVVATTGHDGCELDVIHLAAKSVPVFYSGNMSIGVAVMRLLVEQAARLLEDFDVEIIEAHHRFKQDAPSGTAKMLVEAAQKARPDLVETYGRVGHTGKRKPHDIGVHAVRGGTIVGEHSVIFAGTDEILEVKHTALSKAIFAKGALKAARYLLNVPAGLYNMDDLNHTQQLGESL